MVCASACFERVPNAANLVRVALGRPELNRGLRLSELVGSSNRRLVVSNLVTSNLGLSLVRLVLLPAGGVACPKLPNGVLQW